MKSLFKNTIKLAGLLFSVLPFVCCAPEEIPGDGTDHGVEGGVPMPQIKAAFTPMTDVDGKPEGKLKWNASDQIKVFVVPSDGPVPEDLASAAHRFVTDGRNCKKNVFKRSESYGLSPDQSNDWYVMSPYNEQGSNVFSLDGQIMDVEHPENHLAAFDIMTAMKRNVPVKDEPEFSLVHQCMLMKFRICNHGTDKLNVTEITVTSPSGIGISGTYEVDFNNGMQLVPQVKRNQAILKFSEEIVLEAGEEMEAGLIMPPFELMAGQSLKIQTMTSTGVMESCVVADDDVTFSAGSVNVYSLDLKPAELTIMVDKIPIHMIHVIGSTFMMGATPEQEEVADNDEKPVHQVTLSDYYIGKYEVTQELWTAVMGDNPSEFQGSRACPVDNVSWEDIVNGFLPRLNEMTGMEFKLPTEAQWEFAARGGVRSEGYRFSGSDNVNEVGWYESNSNGRTQPVGMKLPNELGIYDMSGNVWEWCQDWYTPYTDQPAVDPTGAAQGDARILRGAAYNYAAWNCRISFRSINYPDYENPYYGFRLALN